MVDIERLDAFCKAAVLNCSGLGDYEIVASESELKDIIDDVSNYDLLVCVLPDIKGDDVSYDNIAEENMGLFFVLDVLRESMTKEQRLNLWKSTALSMKEFKEFIHDQYEGDFHDLFGDMDFSNRSIQPEYNLVGCSGWGLMFKYSTDGF